MLRAPHWRGPYALANPLAVTRPESEDSFVLRTTPGYHMLTNVNNDHARCAEGQACGGHAWGRDGLHFSNLAIGAFGPAIPLRDGSGLAREQQIGCSGGSLEPRGPLS